MKAAGVFLCLLIGAIRNVNCLETKEGGESAVSVWKPCFHHARGNDFRERSNFVWYDAYTESNQMSSSVHERFPIIIEFFPEKLMTSCLQSVLISARQTRKFVENSPMDHFLHPLNHTTVNRMNNHFNVLFCQFRQVFMVFVAFQTELSKCSFFSTFYLLQRMRIIRLSRLKHVKMFFSTRPS